MVYFQFSMVEYVLQHIGILYNDGRESRLVNFKKNAKFYRIYVMTVTKRKEIFKKIFFHTLKKTQNLSHM